MRVYFTADNQAEERLQKTFSQIIDTLNDSGVLVMSNLANRNLVGWPTQDLEKIEQSGESMIEKMDALIIEGTRPLAESGYLIAIALAHHKPILYLCLKDKIINQNLIHLKKDHQAAKLLNLEYYTVKNLNEILVEFLRKIETGEGKETPNIKFTLRITSRIERYLQWKTHNTRLTKADFLRELIEGLIDKDKDYQNFADKE
ncbi:MAG: hypothetical protein WCW26_01005 [Candidatus Buchananbacteria bacterium]